MWDCKHRTTKDGCRLIKKKCYPGRKDCVLEDKYEYPLRQELDKHKAQSSDKKKAKQKRKKAD